MIAIFDALVPLVRTVFQPIGARSTPQTTKTR